MRTDAGFLFSDSWMFRYGSVATIDRTISSNKRGNLVTVYFSASRDKVIY